MNLMNREKGTVRAKENVHYVASQTLHQNTVLAMSNLLNANIDTGLMYAIGKTTERRDISFLKSLLTLICGIERNYLSALVLSQGLATTMIFRPELSSWRSSRKSYNRWEAEDCIKNRALFN